MIPLSDVRVALTASDNRTDPGSNSVTDSKGYYKVIGVEHRPWWAYDKEWDVVFQKEGYETVKVILDKKKIRIPIAI